MSTKFSDIVTQLLMRQYHNAGHTVKEIALASGCTKLTVRKNIRITGFLGKFNTASKAIVK